MLSVICPIYNEERYIEACIESIVAQDFPKDNLEVIFADGMSTDRTREIVAEYTARYPWIRLIDNPERIVPPALNAAIKASKGDIIMRLDAHASYPPNYFSALYNAHKRIKADNIGAVCKTDVLNKSSKSLAIREVLAHPLGVGNSAFRTGIDKEKEVDTVPFGCWRREVFDKYGLFDERLVRNQDIELSKRIIRGGGKIVIIPSYKPGEYVWECLESLNRQTLAKDRFEVIFVLNGCNEPWKSDLQKWFDAHPELNVNFIQTDTPGVSNARNIALSQIKGEYVTFIDDDDYISDSFLEEMMRVADPKTVVLTDSQAFIEGENGYINNYAQHLVFKKCSSTNDQNILHARSIFNGPCMKLLPRSFIHGVSFDTSFKNGEDSIFMFEISKNISNLAYADNKAIYYRRVRPNSATTVHRSITRLIRDNLRVSAAMAKRYLKAPFSYNLPFFISRVLAPLKSIYLTHN